MTGNESYTYIRNGDKLDKYEIDKDVLISDDKLIRAHLVHTEPAYYQIEQRMRVNPDDMRGWAWRTILQVTDFASVKRFITAHNIGDNLYQHYALRQYARFDCPITLQEYTYKATI